MDISGETSMDTYKELERRVDELNRSFDIIKDHNNHLLEFNEELIIKIELLERENAALKAKLEKK